MAAPNTGSGLSPLTGGTLRDPARTSRLMWLPESQCGSEAIYFVGPDCYQHVRAYTDCLQHKIHDGRAFCRCQSVMVCLLPVNRYGVDRATRHHFQ